MRSILDILRYINEKRDTNEMKAINRKISKLREMRFEEIVGW